MVSGNNRICGRKGENVGHLDDKEEEREAYRTQATQLDHPLHVRTVCKSRTQLKI